MSRTPALRSEPFDIVICVFGIFFLPDMAAAVAELWRLVRPGGALAVTVWGPRFLEPATTAFWDAVGAERPDQARRSQAEEQKVLLIVLARSAACEDEQPGPRSRYIPLHVSRSVR
jgi:SAM-dependent methyltransferase